MSQESRKTGGATENGEEPAVRMQLAQHGRIVSPWGRAIVTIGSVGAAALVRLALGRYVEENVPYMLFLAAVAVTSFACGWRAGVASVFLSLIVGTYAFAFPRGALRIDNPSDALSAAVFLLAAALIIVALALEARAKRRIVQQDTRLLDELAERARLERELAEARRLEGLGRLAGGVAHDFNNLLSVVLGSSELLRRHPEDAMLVDSIELAAKRGAGLTRQLLGLARRQILNVRPLSLAECVREARALAQRLIPEDIRIECELEDALWLVSGDPTQIQQILLNLVTNARDALPQGGTIHIRTSNVTLSERFAKRNPEVTPGEYVLLSVSDDGQGMSDELQRRIFDPFFTTKEGERGTGLGLALVYGIVKQLGGHVSVKSRPGHGTTFDLYFPRTIPVSSSTASGDEPALAMRPMTVLLVEDDGLVRSVTTRMLEVLGHRVVAAENGAVALNAARGFTGPIDLLLTDVVMPWMSGRELAERLRAARPELAVVFMSGYTDNLVLQRGIVKPGILLLKKPFNQQELAAALETALRDKQATA